MRRDPAYLLDMLLAARDALQFAEGLTREAFDASEIHQAAISRKLEVLGEAASRISQETRKAHPEIPWKDIVATRNRVIHGYFDVDLNKVWAIVKHDLAALIAAVEPLVPPPKQ